MSKGLRHFPELDAVFECAQQAAGLGRVSEEAIVRYRHHDFPILSIEFGSQEKGVPTLVFVGGVHGLEKVGTEVVISYLRSFIRLLRWDESTQNIMDRCRLVFYPLANPVGMFRRTRSNGKGVDIMRNSKIDAGKVKVPILGGHRISPLLPWFRGKKGSYEIETRALMEMMTRYLSTSDLVVSLDVHSGFGLVDRLWFPYASSSDVFPESHRLLLLKKNLDSTYPNHVYVIEPQSVHYTTHGDLWDDLHIANAKDQKNTFIPLCLEMGSWAWIRKNPKQALTGLGLFNPMLPHRLARIQRRHMPLFDFLLRSIYSFKGWSEMSLEKEEYFKEKAKMLWYT